MNAKIKGVALADGEKARWVYIGGEVAELQRRLHSDGAWAWTGWTISVQEFRAL